MRNEFITNNNCHIFYELDRFMRFRLTSEQRMNLLIITTSEGNKEIRILLELTSINDNYEKKVFPKSD